MESNPLTSRDFEAGPYETVQHKAGMGLCLGFLNSFFSLLLSKAISESGQEVLLATSGINIAQRREGHMVIGRVEMEG